MTLRNTAIMLYAFLGASLLSTLNPARADEGMWLFNNPPKKLLKEKYNFEVTDKWLGHLQQAAVRFNSGGSGSFVSPDGLVITNHHVGADALQKLSTAERDYLKTGFHAKTRAEEVKCVDLELNVLISIQDVTKRVNAAVKADMSAADSQKARRAIMNTIEKESTDKTGLRSDVITLYQGGLYHLYRYKKYTDVRLVFAPEQAIAFFGGDPDNFEYPRYDLDICIFRVYENDKPLKLEHFLSWSTVPLTEDELIFVAGNPGRTDRINTIEHLKYMRDKKYPFTLNLLRRREVLLKNYSERTRENARRAQDDLFGIQNSRKAQLGGLAGLQDRTLLVRNKNKSLLLQQQMARTPEHRKDLSAFKTIATTLDGYLKYYDELMLWEQGIAFNSELFTIARDIVRMAEESKKPNAERLREFRESNLESLKLQLFSEAPIYDDLEIVKLTDSLSMLGEMLSFENPLVAKVMDGKSPHDRAVELVQRTKLKDVDYRKKLAAEPFNELQKSSDPMIQLALLVDGTARKYRKMYEEQVEETLRQAYAKLANAQFAMYGTNTYPDATFTLRLAFGVVRGYEEDGRKVPPWTTIRGAFEHSAEHDNQPPFDLPKSWLEHKKDLNLDTQMNFVSTADIIGGNSGSPVVNRAGEFVGIIFDGNIQSLVLDFTYSDTLARAVSVNAVAITEALRKVYGANELADELELHGPKL